MSRNHAPRIDLDYNATTPLDPEARAALIEALSLDGNPSSVHAAGRRARQAVEEARVEVARLVGAAAEEVVFTSGGTEADQLGVRGGARAARAAAPERRRVVASRLEHPAVVGALETLADEGFVLTWVAPSPEGVLCPDEMAAALGPDVALVALQLANHELGTVQPVAEVARAAHAAGAWVHCDAVQAAGKLALDVDALEVDLLALSAHKLHGPKGVGALVVRRGRVLPSLAGRAGHQERERRPGTENVPGIVGFGAAARVARREAAAWERVRVLGRRLEDGLVALGARVHGGGAPRVGNTVNAAFPGCPGELVVESLDLAGVAVSQGAACSSGVRAPSPVLQALGQSRAQAAEAVRFSLGRGTTDDEIARVLLLLPELLARIRAA